MTLEQRVTALEKEVADLKRQLGGQPEHTTNIELKIYGDSNVGLMTKSELDKQYQGAKRRCCY